MHREVLKAFRRLMKSRSALFAGDARALNVTRLEIRKSFMQNSTVTDTNKLTELIADAYEAATVLDRNIVPVVFNEKTKRHVLRIRPSNTDDSVKGA